MSKVLKLKLDDDREASLEVGRSVVVNVRREAYDVYCGRPHPTKPGADGYFGNPHGDSPDIGDYIRYFHRRLQEDPEFRKRLDGLTGKKLGCWCHPKFCHAMIIAVWCNCTKPEQRRLLKSETEHAVKVFNASAVHWWGT